MTMCHKTMTMWHAVEKVGLEPTTSTVQV